MIHIRSAGKRAQMPGQAKTRIRGKLILSVPMVFFLLSGALLQGGVFFGFDINPAFFKGEISPASGTPPSMNLVFSFGGGLTLRSTRVGLIFHSTSIQNGYRIDFDDGTSEEFDIRIQGIGFSLGYVRKPFFASVVLSPSSFAITSSTEPNVSPHYEITSEKDWGLVIPVTAGLTWKAFYLGGSITYHQWSSSSGFNKYESPLPYHWYLVDAQRTDCTINGIAIGLSFGMRLEI